MLKLSTKNAGNIVATLQVERQRLERVVPTSSRFAEARYMLQHEPVQASIHCDRVTFVWTPKPTDLMGIIN